MKRVELLFYIIIFLFPLHCLSVNNVEVELFETQQTDTIIINLKDYGLEKIRKKDCTKIINNAFSEIDSSSPIVIVFPRGEYHFYSDQSVQRSYLFPGSTTKNSINCAILFEDKRNVVIDGNGSTLIFHGMLQPFTLINCENITLKNIKIDWEQPFMAQAKVVKANDEFIEITIDLKDSPYRVENGKLYFDVDEYVPEIWKNVTEFDRKDRYIILQTGELECLGKGWENYTAENIIPGVIRLYYPFLRKPKIGNFLVLQHTDQNYSGIYIRDSKNITLENINLYHSIGIGILAQNSENLLFKQLNVIPNKAKNRYFSSVDEGLFISDCKGEIIVDDCEFAGTMSNVVTIEENDNQSGVNSNYSILNSQFKSSLGSGINISSANNFNIKKNYFESSGSGIIVTGKSTNILIESNEFADLCNSGWYEKSEAIISINTENTTTPENSDLAHKNITISNNKFNPFDYPVLFAQFTDELLFEKNTINRSKRFEPFQEKPYTFIFEGCNNVTLQGNTFGDEVLGKNIQLKNTPVSNMNITTQPELTIDN